MTRVVLRAVIALLLAGGCSSDAPEDASVTVDAGEDGGACRAGGAPCTDPADCCSGVCVGVIGTGMGGRSCD